MAQLSRHHVPNVLSSSRIWLFGPAVFFTAERHYWSAALVALIAGVATDVFDGVIARRWDIVSEYGSGSLEPLGDVVLAIGALLGLIRTEHSMGVAFTLIATYAAIWFLANFRPWPWLHHRVVVWLAPLYNLAVIWTLLVVYANIALSGMRFRAFIIAELSVTVLLIVFKWGRVQYWWDRVMQHPHPPASS